MMLIFGFPSAIRAASRFLSSSKSDAVLGWALVLVAKGIVVFEIFPISGGLTLDGFELMLNGDWVRESLMEWYCMPPEGCRLVF